MSIRVMSMVFAAQGLTSAQKLVLLSLADHGNDDGISIYPSIKKTAERTGLSERWVTKTIKSLREDLKIIVFVGSHNLYSTNELAINIAKLERMKGGMNPVQGGGEPSSPGGVNPVHQGGEPSSPESLVKSLVESLTESLKESPNFSPAEQPQEETHPLRKSKKHAGKENNVKVNEHIQIRLLVQSVLEEAGITDEGLVIRLSSRISRLMQDDPEERAGTSATLDALVKGERGERDLREEWSSTFRTDPNWNTKTNKDFLLWLKERPDGESLTNFGKWWYANDFRGKAGAPPTVSQVRELWRMGQDEKPRGVDRMLPEGV